MSHSQGWLKQESYPVARNTVVLSLIWSFSLFLLVEASRRVCSEAPIFGRGSSNSKDPEKAGIAGGRVVRGSQHLEAGWEALQASRRAAQGPTGPIPWGRKTANFSRNIPIWGMKRVHWAGTPLDQIPQDPSDDCWRTATGKGRGPHLDNETGAREEKGVTK